MRTANTLIIATANRHKVEEFQELFKPWPSIRVAPASEFIRNPEKLPRPEKPRTKATSRNSWKN